METKKIFKSPWTYFIIVLIILGTIYSYKIVTGKSIESGQYDVFAQCLTEAGLKMYGTDWCGYCKKQKELFGDSFQYIDYIDCDKNRQECLDAGVKGYPTWKINEQNYPGLQSLERLAELTECGLL